MGIETLVLNSIWSFSLLRMKIVQIGAFPVDTSLIRGGVEASVFGLALEQAKTSKVYVIDCPRLDIADSVEEFNGMLIYRFHNPGTHQKDSQKRIKRIVEIIEEIKPDICHIHGTSVFSWALFKGLKRASVPVILTVHGLIYVEKKKALKQHFSMKLLYQFLYQSRAERELLSAQESIIVDTGYVAKTIEGYRLKRTPRMSIIPQGIDETYFGISCSSTSRTVLSVGSLSKRKGHHLLIQAFSLAAEKMPDIRLVICGAMADPAYYSYLKNLAAGTHCSDRILIMSDLHKEELFEQFRNAHIFALHTQEESQGIVFAEAMATGLPIVATNVGGVPFVVSNGENGILVDYGNVGGFSQAIISTMSLRDNWKIKADKCRKASMEYSWAVIARKIEVEYKKMIES